MTSIKKVIKNSAIYSGYAILVKGINFFLLPLYTIYLTTSDYGILSVIESYVGLISIFVTFALGRSATRFYFKYKNNLDDIKELWGSIIVFVLFSSIIVFLALFLFNNIFVSPFLKDVAFFPYVFLGIIPILFNPSFIIYQSSLQIQHMGKQFSLINLLRFGTRLGLILTFVIYFGYGAKGVLLSSAITSIIFFAYTAWFFFPVITLRLKRKKIIESLKFSIPLMPRSIAGWAYGMVDKILLNNIKSSADAGLYSVGFQFGFVINFIVDSVHQAYKPWVFENFEAGEQGIKNISKYICTFVLIYAYLATCLSLFGEEILKVIVSKSFEDSWIVIPLVSFSFVLTGMNYFFAYPIEYSIKNAKFLIIPIFIGSGSNILLNLYTIPLYGIIGAAVSTLVAHLITASVTLILLNRVTNFKLPWKRMALYFMIFFVISLSAYLGSFKFLMPFLVFKFVLVIILTCIIWIIFRRDFELIYAVYFKKKFNNKKE